MKTSISDDLVWYVKQAREYTNPAEQAEATLNALLIAQHAFVTLSDHPYSACSPQVRKWLACVSKLITS